MSLSESLEARCICDKIAR